MHTLRLAGLADKPPQKHEAKCEFGCYPLAKNRDYAFTEYCLEVSADFGSAVVSHACTNPFPHPANPGSRSREICKQCLSSDN